MSIIIICMELLLGFPMRLEGAVVVGSRPNRGTVEQRDLELVRSTQTRLTREDVYDKENTRRYVLSDVGI